MMRDVAELIGNWNGTFLELCNELTPEEFDTMVNDTVYEYVDATYMDELLDKGDYRGILALYIKDWLMFNISDNYDGKTTNNLFRLWSNM
jgi:hypothetical protein